MSMRSLTLVCLFCATLTAHDTPSSKINQIWSDCQTGRWPTPSSPTSTLLWATWSATCPRFRPTTRLPMLMSSLGRLTNIALPSMRLTTSPIFRCPGIRGRSRRLRMWTRKLGHSLIRKSVRLLFDQLKLYKFVIENKIWFSLLIIHFNNIKDWRL